MDLTREIYDVAEHFLDHVRPSGSENVIALCPYHQETTPSFAMNVTTGVFFCHACHARGNLRTFLKDMGVSHSVLNLKYKALLEEVRRNMPTPPNPLKCIVFDLTPLDESILGLLDVEHPLLLNAGFQRETLRHFEVGYDRWHNRVTFPIRDIKGALVGISGRALDIDVWPRYKIYAQEYTSWGLPPRENWDKRGVLYNANVVYPTSLMSNPSDKFIIVVEGFKACMWLHQAGFHNVVALLGSYLSWEHKWILERIGCPVYLFLDNNDAGLKGTIGAATSLLPSIPSVRVINYPARLEEDEDAQPDSLTTEELIQQVYTAEQYPKWVQQQYMKAR